MGLLFRGVHPLFTSASQVKAKENLERSPYFWWFEYLKRNEDYRNCCLNGGNGPLADLYKDWGVVLNDTSFKAWWRERGFYLFSERRKSIQLQELESQSQWDPTWTAQEVMVVAVPLDLPKRYIQGFLARLLKSRHKGKRGRQARDDKAPSTARYPLNRVTVISALRIQLSVYDAVIASKRGENVRTLAKIGADMALVKSAMPSPRDRPKEAADKRAVMAATVSRYFRQAKQNIDATTRGIFPLI